MSTEKLIEAIRNGNRQELESVLTAEPALATAAGPNGASPILLSVYYRHPELAQVLVSHGAKVGINEASAMGDLAQVKAFVAVDPKAVNEYSADGFFPLGLAIFFGHREVAEFLLQSGADVHQVARNAQHVTSLHAAIARQDFDLARTLLERGADANARQQAGFTPLHEAAAVGNERIMQLLVEHGAAINARNDEGKTSYDMAMERSKNAAAEWLKQHGAAVSTPPATPAKP